MADVLNTQIPNISWRRDLIGNKLISWNNLLSRLEGIELRQERDEFRWNLDQSGVFSVKSHYLGLIHQDTPNLNKKTLETENPTENQNLLMVSQEGCHSHKRQPSETKLARKSTVLFLS